jgi:uncharacterized delta-60 repeat protein
VDQNFGNGGFLNSALAPGVDDFASGLAVQTDGKIILSGEVDGQFALARFDAAGNVDASFGAAGTVVTSLPGGFDDVAAGIALQADGQIIVAGSVSYAPSGQTAMAVARYNTDGSLDSTFGNGGVIETVLGNNSTVTDVAIQADGDIVAAGVSLDVAVIGGGSGSGAVLVRYTRAGQLDTTFGDNGHVFTGIQVDDYSIGATASAGPKLAL